MCAGLVSNPNPNFRRSPSARPKRVRGGGPRSRAERALAARRRHSTHDARARADAGAPEGRVRRRGRPRPRTRAAIDRGAMEEFERELKVVILGDGGVGKTSLVRRFATGIFTDSYKKTIGVDFLERMLYLPALGEEARLMLWDTAGQEEFDTLTRAYYRGAACAVLAFSTVDRKSFFAVRSWRAKLAAECGNSLPTVLVQTKVDLMGSVEDGGEEGEDGKRIVGPDEAEGLAEQLGLRFHRISTKENLGVDSVFRDLATLAINAQDAAPVMASAAPREISVAEIGQIGGGQQQQQRQPPQAKRPSQVRSSARARSRSARKRETAESGSGAFARGQRQTSQTSCDCPRSSPDVCESARADVLTRESHVSRRRSASRST